MCNPIFIDRDKDLFKYILAWYRDDCIVIPRTVAVSALRNEMKFFCLPDDILVEQEKATMVECFVGVREFASRDENTLFATWGLQKALKDEFLGKRGQTMDATVKSYHDYKPDVNMREALIEAKKKIHEYGFDSICTVDYMAY